MTRPSYARWQRTGITRSENKVASMAAGKIYSPPALLWHGIRCGSRVVKGKMARPRNTKASPAPANRAAPDLAEKQSESNLPEPPRGRRAQRTAEKRNRITQVASEYIAKHGFEELSVEAIAAEAGISVGGIYRYIGTKTDLLVMACQDIYDGLREHLAQITHGPGDHLARLVSALDYYFVSSEHNRRKIRMMYREYRRLPPLAQEDYKNREAAISDVFADLIRSGISQEVFQDVNIHALAYDIILLGHLPALKGWAIRSRVTSDEWRKEQINLIISRLTSHRVSDRA